MNKRLTSIIMTCYDQSQTARHTSMLAAANITRYTNPDEYELIIIDCCPKYPFRDDYKVLKIDNFIVVNPPDIGYYQAMNLGAKEAKGEYLCFIENDVFVQEGWLENLRFYLEKGTVDAIMPDQIPCTRQQQLSYYKYDSAEALGKGATEQGLMMITREAFDKTGGWDPKMKMVYGWKRFYQQIGENGLHLNNTAKVTISHITGMTYYDTLEHDPEKHALISKSEGEYLNG